MTSQRKRWEEHLARCDEYLVDMQAIDMEHACDIDSRDAARIVLAAIAWAEMEDHEDATLTQKTLKTVMRETARAILRGELPE